MSSPFTCTDRLLRWLLIPVLVLLPALVAAQAIEKALMPGEVIEGQGKFELDCDQCHQRFDKAAQILLPVDYSGQGIWNQFTLRVLGGRRDALKAFLTGRKIGCEIYYPIPLHRQQCFVDQKYRGHDRVPVSEQLATEVLSIPVFPELTGEQRQWVADSLADFAAGKTE